MTEPRRVVDRVRFSRGGAVLSALMLAIVLVATLTPTPGAPALAGFWCLFCGQFWSLDFTANVVMFVPLGFAFALASDRWRASVLACVAVTVFVEWMQVGVVAGRDASASDIIANSLGGIVGASVAIHRHALVRPASRAAMRLGLGAAALFALVTSLTSAALRPATVPRSLWVQWTPDRASFEPFTGQLQRLELDGIDLPRRFYPPVSLGVDRVLRSPVWHVTATVGTAKLEPRRSVIARIAEEFTVLVSIEQLGWDVACQQKVRASDFHFRSPKVVLRDALSASTDAAPRAARLTCSRETGTLVSAADGRREVLRLSPSLGWVLMSPFDVAMTPAYRWIGMVWLFALAFPSGYWMVFAGGTGDRAGSPRTVTRRRRLAVPAALSVSLMVGLLVAPLAAGTSPAAWWEWAGASLGAFTGMALARVLATRKVTWFASATNRRGPVVHASETAR